MNLSHARRWTLPAAVLLLSGCQLPEGDPQISTEPTARPVRVAVAVKQAEARQLRLPAALRSTRRADLAFLTPGTLATRHVQLGERVSAGQRVATLHDPTLEPGVNAARARVRENQARLEQLELDTRRQQTLVERNLAAVDSLDQIRTRRDAARAALEQARAELERATNQLAETDLHAPFDGVVADFYLEPGDFAAAGQSVMAVYGRDGLEAEVLLPAEIRPSDIETVQLLRLGSGERREARIASFGEARPGRPRPVRIEAAAGSERWESGEPVQVELGLIGPERIAVPLAALVDPGTGSARLFRVRDGRAERIAVATGSLSGEFVTITGPVTAGDRIIIAGQAHLLDGDTVRVLP